MQLESIQFNLIKFYWQTTYNNGNQYTLQGSIALIARHRHNTYHPQFSGRVEILHIKGRFSVGCPSLKWSLEANIASEALCSIICTSTSVIIQSPGQSGSSRVGNYVAAKMDRWLCRKGGSQLVNSFWSMPADPQKKAAKVKVMSQNLWENQQKLFSNAHWEYSKKYRHHSFLKGMNASIIQTKEILPSYHSKRVAWWCSG